jgi:hypothetical protein
MTAACSLKPKDMRDNKWLAQRLKYIWERYFPEVIQKNDVIVRFGRRSRNRLGSIQLETERPSLVYVGLRRLLGLKPKTIIILNGYAKSNRVPEFVIDAIIAHELSHYAHGFGSVHRQKFRYPHKHGVVRSELQRRGLEELFKKQKAWTKLNWLKIVTR